ncbi:MAG: hypothetical protein AAF611_21585 [Bacteroidota bacterium]
MSIKKGNRVHWWQVYNEISTLLVKHYNEWKTNSERKLYEICENNEAFINENSWFKKNIDKKKTKGLDPIHIFASISGNRLREDNRIRRITIILALLKSENEYTSIDFFGCPTPAVISILSARSHESQTEIWNFFIRVYNSAELISNDFANYGDWYGIKFTSLTIFLFWIRSDMFLPVDRNTQDFLKKYNLKVPRGYQEYEYLLEIVRENNSETDEGYGEKGLFREVALHAYDEINNVKSSSKKTFSYLSLIEKLELGTYDVFNKVQKNYKAPIIEIEELVVDREFAVKKKGNPISGLGFKLIAVVPEEGCKHLKILKKEPLYFEKTFSITDKEEVCYYPKNQLSLYDLKLGNQTLKVNITAIVGKNGSGKSSLVELLFRMINNITFQFHEEIYTEEIEFEAGVNAKLYYIVDEYLYCIHVNDTKNTIQEYTFNEGDNKFIKLNNKRGLIKSDLDSFFYTVAINYSHYALNSLDIGTWIEKLFHKNDAYQAPIVLNPMRTKGNIDINTEDKLVKSRLLVNLFREVETDDLGMRQLTEKQKVDKIEFKLNNEKSKVWVKDKRLFFDITDTQLYSDRVVILETIYEKFNFSRVFPNDEDEAEIFRITEKYILKKLVSISEKYAPYHHYLQQQGGEVLNSIDIDLIEVFAQQLFEDKSHITYKLRQAIHYIKYKNFIPWETEFTMTLDDINDKKEEFFDNGFKEINDIPLIELLPPSIFDVNIKLINTADEKNPTDFKFLSSGEKQQIYAASSILYHFQNIDSVDNENFITYNNLNFLLDEIELYYHPEMQRSYLAYLLKMLSRMEIRNMKSINICMVTHSPYILSDIPSNYLLQLEDGKPSQKEEDNTFGANIHDLLAHNFFMSSTTGEFAQTKIREIVDFYYRVKRYVETSERTNGNSNNNISQNQSKGKLDTKDGLKLLYEDHQEQFRYIIKNMGEDVIKGILENHIKFIENKLGIQDKQFMIEKLNEEIRLRQEELSKLQDND